MTSWFRGLLEEKLPGHRQKAVASYEKLRNQLTESLGQARIRVRHSIYAPEDLLHGFLRSAMLPGEAGLAAVLTVNIDVHGLDLVELRLHQALWHLRRYQWSGASRRLFTAGLEVLSHSDEQRAIDLGESYIETLKGARAAMLLAKLYRQRGAIHRPLQLLEAFAPRMTGRAIHRKLSNDALLDNQGMPFQQTGARDWQPASRGRILYHVNQCPPHHSSGYAIRTHSLAHHLVSRGWELEVFARYGYPNDRDDYQDRDLSQAEAIFDDIHYHFVPSTLGFRSLSPQKYQEKAVQALCKQAEIFRPALIHTATNQIVGLAGTQAARQLGIRSIYEMRGLWHMTRASQVPEYQDSEHYRMTQALEVQAATQADHVFAITDAIRDILIEEGISPAKITVIPNAVDTDRFRPASPDQKLKSQLGYQNETIIGFIGSFGAYEGLDHLLRAAAVLQARGHDDFHLLLVGDGAVGDDLNRLAGELGIRDIVTFTGRVPHDRVRDYYSLIDIAAFPRKGVKVCEVVSPLKPYEAMAMEAAVVVSDVQALAEMVQDGTTGLVHRRDDVESLAACLEQLLASKTFARGLGKQARVWVEANRTWQAVTGLVESAYQQLLASDTASRR